jgi:hypothetical protein
MINPNDELHILGEEPNSVLVKTPDGEEQLLPRERMTKYVQVGNKLTTYPPLLHVLTYDKYIFTKQTRFPRGFVEMQGRVRIFTG